MEAEARYTLVGAGAVLLVAILVATVLWLNKFAAQDAFTDYTIYFENQRIDGLQIDSDVDMRGVSVGRVVSFALADYQAGNMLINRVRVVISLDSSIPVFTNTVAVITRNLVTGIAQVSLVTPNTEGAQMLTAMPGEPYSVIAEGRSDLEEIAGKVERLGDMAGEIMGNLNRLLSLENREAFTSLIVNLSELTGNLNQRMTRLDEVLGGIDEATGSINRAGQDISGLAGNISGQVELLVGDVRNTISEAEAAMRSVSTAMLALQTQGETLTTQLDRTGAVLSDQMAAAVTELRRSLESAELTLQRLQDPRSAVLGVSPSRLGPGENP
jgi:phospholipid/cholesterol/gamma-HCH transport system substrate-binding protein